MQMLERLQRKFKAGGLLGLMQAAGRRVLPRRAACRSTCRELLRGRRGLEIGGPSSLFSPGGMLPIYDVVAELDNVNFCGSTLWEGTIRPGLTFQYHPQRSAGRQYLAEASHLPEIADLSYDFLISSHTLEHVANPLAALHQWRRVLQPGGTLVLVLPHKDGTFDHRRPVTTLEHLIDDFRQGTDEDDLTHLDEILRLHDLARDPLAGSAEQFKARSLRNFENRSLHHHVFDTRLAVQAAAQAGFGLLKAEGVPPFHIVVLARKPAGDEPPDNDAFLEQAAWRRVSPFPSDRKLS